MLRVVGTAVPSRRYFVFQSPRKGDNMRGLAIATIAGLLMAAPQWAQEASPDHSAAFE